MLMYMHPNALFSLKGGRGRRLGTSKIGILAGKSIVGEIVQFHKSCARAEKEVEKCEN